MKNRNIILGAILSVLAWFGPLPAARAVVPAPDGGYPNWNTAEGTNALFHLTSGIYNTALGGQALFGNTTGNFNTATGVNALYHNIDGGKNIATGVQALFSNTSGTYNTASGYQALYRDTTGNGNTGSGYQALYSNQTGANNAAFGYTSLYYNTGSFNAAFGSQTLVYNTTGGGNTATGYQALVFNTGGVGNTAGGYQALYSNTIGYENTASGDEALYSNHSGAYNTANGHQALYSNTIGYENTASGDGALYSNQSGDDNTALGVNALYNNTVGHTNTAIGLNTGYNTTGSNNILINNTGLAGENNTIRIGANSSQTSTYIAGIAGHFVGVGGTTCYVDNAGKLGVSLSARRFKTDIADMGFASEALLALRPVTFHYKPELDKTGIPQFGLIAEEVAKVNPDLVTHDAKGELSTVRYDAVNAMLLNEFLKEHRKNEEQQKQINVLTAQLKEQAAQIQKVSGQLEASKPVPQVVNNP